MRISRLLILAAALLLMVSCQNKAQKEQNEPEFHELLTVTAQDYTLDAEYPASIHGAQDIKIIPRVEGHLMGVYVKEGERVREGQLLFRLDDAPSRAAVESANANVQMMTAALSRVQLEYNGKKNLRQKSVISEFELSLAESEPRISEGGPHLRPQRSQLHRNPQSFQRCSGANHLPQGRTRGTFHPGRTHRGGRQPADAGLFLDDGKNGDAVPFRAQKYGSGDKANARTAAATAQRHPLRAYRPCGEHQRRGGRAHRSRLGLRPLRQPRRNAAQWRYGQNRCPHRTAQRHRHPTGGHLQHPGQGLCDESGGRQGSLHHRPSVTAEQRQRVHGD